MWRIILLPPQVVPLPQEGGKTGRRGRTYRLQKWYRVVSKVGIYGICPYGLLLLDRGEYLDNPSVTQA
ncbi:MAG: hypothetical protein IKC47_04090 [Clostridia bacterium]|nr:hypothetical protein [Clostridia bacterium]